MNKTKPTSIKINVIQNRFIWTRIKTYFCTCLNIRLWKNDLDMLSSVNVKYAKLAGTSEISFNLKLLCFSLSF